MRKREESEKEMEHQTAHWFEAAPRRRDAELRLFCFPPVGMDAFFQTWQQQLPASIEVCALRLSDRERSLDKAACVDVGAISMALAHAISAQGDRPFAFYGHSLGSLIAFETARSLRACSNLSPVALLLASLPAPQLAPKLCARAFDVLQYPDERVVTFFLPPESEVASLVVQDAQLTHTTASLVRRDLATLALYQYEADEPFQCPLTILGGWEDHLINYAELAAWQEQTTGKFCLQMLSGDHLFMSTGREALLKAVQAQLQSSPVPVSGGA